MLPTFTGWQNPPKWYLWYEESWLLWPPLSELLPTLRKSSDTSPDEFSCQGWVPGTPKQWENLMVSFPYHSHIFRDSYGNSAFLRYTSKVSGVNPSKVFLPDASGIYPTPKKNKIDTQNGHSLKGIYIFQTIIFGIHDYLYYYIRFLGKVNLPIHPCGWSSLVQGPDLAQLLVRGNGLKGRQCIPSLKKKLWSKENLDLSYIYIYIYIYIYYMHTHPGKLKKQKNNIEQMPGRFLKLQLLPKENHRFRFWILSHCHSFRWISTWSIWPEKPRLGIVSRVNPFGERTVLEHHWTSRTVNAFGFKWFKWFKIFNHHLS